MTSTLIVVLATILLYLIFMIGVGVAFSRKNKKSDDFYIPSAKEGIFLCFLIDKTGFR